MLGFIGFAEVDGFVTIPSQYLRRLLVFVDSIASFVFCCCLVTITAPIAIIVSFVFMIQQLGWAAVAGIAVLVVMVPLNSKIAKVLLSLSSLLCLLFFYVR